MQAMKAYRLISRDVGELAETAAPQALEAALAARPAGKP
jgi:hypothetical protein